MKNKLLIALAFLGLSTTASAQFSDSTETKNHLGIIAKPRLEKIFTSNQSLPVGFIYKRQIKSDQAVRFSVLGSYTRFKNEIENTTYGDFLDETIDNSWQAMIGYEWQKSLSKRWDFYYGLELGISFHKITRNPKFTHNQIAFPFGQILTYNNSNSTNYLLQPLAGFRFNLHPKLYLATETTIAFRYSKHKDEFYSYYISNDGQNEKVEKTNTNTFETLNLRYSPISNLQLVYKF